MVEEIIFLVVPFVIQLCLCFKIKARFIRLLLVFAATFFVIVFIVGVIITPASWERLGYVFLAYYGFVVLMMYVLAWGIWWLIKGRSK